MIYEIMFLVPRSLSHFKRFDWPLFLPMMLLMSFGLVVLLSVDPELARQQVVFAAAGLVIYFFLAFTDYKIIGKFSQSIYFVTTILLILVIVWGISTRGAVRWLQVGFWRIQPSEFSKISLALILASLLTAAQGSLRKIFKSILFSFPIIVLVFFQPDLGTALVLAAIWIGILSVSGVKLSHLLVLITGGLLFFVPGWFLLREYQRQRLLTFINPQADPLGSGYNVIQAIIAVGSGQMFGRGFGRGTQSHLQFLPDYQTDFIFATLSEEWGFLGALILIVLFLILCFRIFKIGEAASSSFGSLLCVGVGVMLVFQIVVNVGMNLGIMPVTGIPLPLISYGGSSLVATLVALGLVQSVGVGRKRLN